MVPLLTTLLPILQGALKDGFGEAVAACDVPELCTFLSVDSCQRSFSWTHKNVDLALHPVVGFVLQVGDAEKFPQALGFESMNRFFFPESGNRVLVSQPWGRMEMTRDL